MLSRCTQMLCIPGVPRHLASLTKNKGVFFKAADLHGEVMMGLCISLLLWNCSTVALNSCNPSLHTVEKFQICLPEHEAAVSNSNVLHHVRFALPSFCRDSPGDLFPEFCCYSTIGISQGSKICLLGKTVSKASTPQWDLR